MNVMWGLGLWSLFLGGCTLAARAVNPFDWDPEKDFERNGPLEGGDTDVRGANPDADGRDKDRA
jgi:hypothetical protein